MVTLWLAVISLNKSNRMSDNVHVSFSLNFVGLVLMLNTGGAMNPVPAAILVKSGSAAIFDVAVTWPP